MLDGLEVSGRLNLVVIIQRVICGRVNSDIHGPLPRQRAKQPNRCGMWEFIFRVAGSLACRSFSTRRFHGGVTPSPFVYCTPLGYSTFVLEEAG